MLDHERNLRLGQRTAAVTPGFQILTEETVPESGFPGQAVFLADSGQLIIWDDAARRWLRPGWVADVADLSQRISVLEGGGTPPPPPPPPDGGTTLPVDTTKWAIELADDFTSLNTANWNIRNNTYSSNESSYLLARNVSIENSVLRIQGKKESVGGRAYTSGYIDTLNKYIAPQYFRAEVRAKLPWQAGAWPAPLWFRIDPTSYSNTEIDIIETVGSERTNPQWHQTVWRQWSPSIKYSTYGPYSSLPVTDAYGWHTYTIEKTPGKIQMWIDGQATLSATSSSLNWFNTAFESGHGYNLRCNLQIGGSWPGEPDASTDWSGDNMAMFVDSIYVWRYIG